MSETLESTDKLLIVKNAEDLRNATMRLIDLAFEPNSTKFDYKKVVKQINNGSENIKAIVERALGVTL